VEGHVVLISRAERLESSLAIAQPRKKRQICAKSSSARRSEPFIRHSPKSGKCRRHVVRTSCFRLGALCDKLGSTMKCLPQCHACVRRIWREDGGCKAEPPAADVQIGIQASRKYYSGWVIRSCGPSVVWISPLRHREIHGMLMLLRKHLAGWRNSQSFGDCRGCTRPPQRAADGGESPTLQDRRAGIPNACGSIPANGQIASVIPCR